MVVGAVHAGDATKHPIRDSQGGRTAFEHRQRDPGVRRGNPEVGADPGPGGQVIPMGLYMDVHRHVDATVEEVRAAHELDLEVQERHGVEYKKYWVDEDSGTIFCLFEGPSSEAGKTVHEEAHGLTTDEIYEVVDGDAD